MRTLLCITTLALAVAFASAQPGPVREGLNDQDQHGKTLPVTEPLSDDLEKPAPPATNEPLDNGQDRGNDKGLTEPLSDDPLGNGEPLGEPLDDPSKLADKAKELEKEKEASKSKIDYCKEVLNNPACQADHGWARAEINRQNRRISSLELAIKRVQNRIGDLERRASIVHPMVWSHETAINGENGILERLKALEDAKGAAPAAPPFVPQESGEKPKATSNQTEANQPNWFMSALGVIWDYKWLVLGCIAIVAFVVFVPIKFVNAARIFVWDRKWWFLGIVLGLATIWFLWLR